MITYGFWLKYYLKVSTQRSLCWLRRTIKFELYAVRFEKAVVSRSILISGMDN